MISKSALLELPWEIKGEHGEVYKRDARALKSMNKALETNYKAVYRKELDYRQYQWKADDLSLDTGYMFVVTGSNRVLFISNSEWFSIEAMK